jgi:radical SAM-linked protein
LIIKFKIGWSLRFLSHAETLRLFQRACIRAGINLQYSQGYNPHPKISLPLPRPVGVESDDELLTLRIHGRPYFATHELDESRIREELSAQLPDGCELLSVSIAKTGASFQPCSATYIFSVREEYIGKEFKDRIKDLLGSESLVVRRMTDEKKSIHRNVDVRGFIKSIELDKTDIDVRCVITSAGSIRVKEVLELLQLDIEKLASPIKRTCVQWRDV